MRIFRYPFMNNYYKKNKNLLFLLSGLSMSILIWILFRVTLEKEIHASLFADTWYVAFEAKKQEKEILEHFDSILNRLQEQAPMESWFEPPLKIFHPVKAFEIGWAPVLEKNSQSVKLITKTFGVSMRTDDQRSWQAPVLHVSRKDSPLQGSDFFSLVKNQTLKPVHGFYHWLSPEKTLYLWNFVYPPRQENSYPSSLLFLAIHLPPWISSFQKDAQNQVSIRLTGENPSATGYQTSLRLFQESFSLHAQLNPDLTQKKMYPAMILALLNLILWLLVGLWNKSPAPDIKINLPIMTSAEEKPAQLKLPESQKTKTSPTSVLLLSDNLITQTLIRSTLKDQKYQLKILHDAKELQEQIKKQEEDSFSILIGDLNENITPEHLEEMIDPQKIRLLFLWDPEKREKNEKNQAIWLQKPLSATTILGALQS